MAYALADKIAARLQAAGVPPPIDVRGWTCVVAGRSYKLPLVVTADALDKLAAEIKLDIEETP